MQNIVYQQVVYINSLGIYKLIARDDNTIFAWRYITAIEYQSSVELLIFCDNIIQSYFYFVSTV